ncbi:MAG: response regulator transcription factor [Acidimicrobiaceae bacterium]|nr:response regulator transcription factor [Acidimicrobiaceae bacterium]
MHIAVVEDDEKIASFLSKGLKAEGYVTTVVSDGAHARDFLPLIAEELDLILLDLSLPSVGGLELLTQWRSKGMSTPVIILTARDDVGEKVKGLDAGATDYVTKPFHFAELLARIRAALRTTEQTASTTLTADDLSLDLITKVAWRAGRRIDLSPREWALLELFLRNPHQVLSRTQILSHVWEYSFDPGSNVVDVYVGYLRRKVNFPGLRPLLQTIRGAGYRLLPPG